MSIVAVPSELMPEKTDFECLSLDAVESTHARRGIAIWQSLRGPRRYPARSELQPRVIAPIMQHMSLVRVIDGGKDFENRFVGDAVVRAHEVPIEHRCFSDIARETPVLINRLLPLFRKVVESAEPLAYRGRTGHDLVRVVYTGFEGVLLPLGENPDAVDHVMYVGTCTVNLLKPTRRSDFQQ